MARLTDIVVRTAAPPPEGYKIYHDETLPGFGVRVTANGIKSFVLMHGTPRRRITLGKYPLIGLADARTAARRILSDQTLSRFGPARLSFAEALTLFIAEKRQKNRARTIDENQRILTKYYPALQKKAVADITTDDVTRVLDKLSDTPGTSLHCFWAMRLFLRWCVKRRYIRHSPIEGLDAPAPTNRRERVLSDVELRAVWQAAEAMGYPFGCVVKLLITTGARRSEIGSLSTDWLDFNNNTCTIPTEQSKNRKAHRFPIGTMAISTLRFAIASAPQNDATYLFPAQGRTNSSFSGWSKAKTQLGKKVIEIHGKPIDFVLHDCRRTFATNWQRLGIKYEVIESYLNHISGMKSGVAGTYQRHRYEAEMREAVDKFEDWFRRVIIEG